MCVFMTLSIKSVGAVYEGIPNMFSAPINGTTLKHLVHPDMTNL